MNAADRLESYAQSFESLNDDEPTVDSKFFRKVAALVRACEDDKVALYRYDRDEILAALAKLQEGEK